MQSPDIILQSSGVVALCKPAGIATQAPPGIDSLERWLRGRLGIGAKGYVGVPHRLDRSVSGVVLLTATPRAARKLSRQFERREVKKTYRALVALREGGLLPAGLGLEPVEWRDWIEKVPDEPRARRAESADAPGARESVTPVRMLGTSAVNHTHIGLEFEPLTGRMHQLRLQSACRGLPILGDELYDGPTEIDAAAADDPRGRPVALHAWRTEYTDPDSGERITREAPLPEWWPALEPPQLG